ncbi:MAG: hypothetical protein Q8K72_09110, partial [Acidimicrobiales bacterium]|nr:hypothetical protein [Acidimicrobiales bacterium]
NNMVDQGAVLILTSAEKATYLQIPSERWVFPYAGADSHDTYAIGERAEFSTSPAIRIAGRRALELAGAGVDDVELVDVYSCFPSAVQIAALELGISTDRPLTVTGGLSFAGGPWNNYVMHAIATTADRLRDDPGGRALVSANGGFITKHAFGVYGTEPAAEGFRHADHQAEVDALPRRELCEEPDGEVAIESWTAMHDRDGAPENGIVVGLLDDGRRAIGTSTDADVLKVLVSEDLAGRRARVGPDGATELL